MTDTYLQKIQSRVDEIIARGGKKKLSASLQAFIKALYAHTPMDFLQHFDDTRLLQTALCAHDFYTTRTKNETCTVRVFNPTKKEHGWESERTVVEFFTPDSPFILDSVTAQLIDKGYRIYEVIHPILHTEHDAKGAITALHNGPTEGVVPQSLMHFEITHIGTKKRQDELKADIENALHFVTLAVEDWQPMREKVDAIITKLGSKKLPFTANRVEEVRDFLSWVNDNNFILLGFRDYDFTKKGGKLQLTPVKDSELGLFRAPDHRAKPMGLSGISDDYLDVLQEKVLLDITKSTRRSVVHRPAHMDYIGIKRFNDKGEVVGESRFLGLFTSSVYYQSAQLIPIIRQKIDYVSEASGFAPNSHNGKALVSVLEGFPRDELLQISQEELFDTAMGIVELGERPSTRLFTRKDPFNRFVSCLIYIPRDRYNTLTRNKIQAHLENRFNGVVKDYYTQVSESPLARVHMLLQLDDIKQQATLDMKQLNKELIGITNSWVDGFRQSLLDELGEKEGERYFDAYVNAFPQSFKEFYAATGAVGDVQHMEEAYDNNRLSIDLDHYQLEQDDAAYFQLKLYYPEEQVKLSDVLPILENMGFHALDEVTFYVTPEHRERGMWVHHFRLELDASPQNEDFPTLAQFKDAFEEALFRIWRGQVTDDKFNSLIIHAQLDWREVMLLRAIGKFITQTNFSYGLETMAGAITKHPTIAKSLVQLFDGRFNPNLSAKKRDAWAEAALSELQKGLSEVQNVAEDKVIRQFLGTINAMLRTNFFQTLDGDAAVSDTMAAVPEAWQKLDAYKRYISFKFDSARVPNLPLPHPHAEIFVYSRDVEGVHLRGGKVARGGLRWSDRLEDYRTEVLGLVKAQMTKNAVIVPVGSKGGFVVKTPPADDSREAFFAKGQQCYRTYLSGLLDITDNTKDGKIIPPKEVVRLDEDDPYLVVAADKGTATFSDIANEVAKSYDFWLGDGFASGGANGYDHKKMGITARGAWVSVQRHFMEMGVDVQKDDFTAIGIGDMSGDVFGNGMLLSKHIRLVGAFNHMHIFIDPNPDAATSFKERQRLFKKPRSSWEDYNTKLISKGGGIFSRSAKSIKLNKEICAALDLPKDTKELTPEALMQAMLKAPVDLLWNGGIGTYIKAEHEAHEQVGDKANDGLRINGKEVGAKVIGEGGNLGCTQQGRIEYALAGGRINTDSIDNSAGVDCSDHEVNIKIALDHAMKHGKLDEATRNEILESMTDEVADLVLEDNTRQTESITISELQGDLIVERYTRHIRWLEEHGQLNRALEFLPSDETLNARQMAGKGFTRPELSVLLAYSKLEVFDDLIASNLPDNAYFTQDLVDYFPEKMQQDFPEEIHAHPLKREIIATIVSNDIVNRMGSSFYQRMRENTGMKGCDVARSYRITRDIFGLNDLWNQISALGKEVSVEAKNSLFLETRRLVERSTAWFLRNFSHPLDAGGLVEDYASGIAEVKKVLENVMSKALKDARDRRLEQYLALGIPKAMAKEVANLEALSSAADIVFVAKGGKLPIFVVADIYYELGTKLHLGWLRLAARQLMSKSYWDNLAIISMVETVFDQQRRLVAQVVESACSEDSCGGALEQWSGQRSKSLARFESFIQDLQKQESITQPMLTIALKRIESVFYG